MLTDEMTRLCAEIVDTRRRRAELRDGLVSENNARRASVIEMCGQFTSARATMGKNTKNDRVAFLHNLRHTVHALQHAMQSDLEGVRRAWTGA